MKNLLAIMAVGLALLGTSACADLGFGVDYDMTDSNPYWSPSGYLGDYYWNTPAWNYGPIYNPRPPLIGNGPGSIILPDRPVRPPETIKPPKPNRPEIVKPLGPNGIGWNPGPTVRPGTIPRQEKTK
ncbi:MAG: hypothetical protein J6C95_06360 [Muribaculaceae bacterium]|nr:hypothetical protein [Muribaculaceae bacterium]